MTLFRLGGAALALALCLLMTPAAFAQQSTDTRVQELEREVRKLKEEIAAMKQSPEGSAPGSEAGRLAEIERRLEILAAEIEKTKIGEAAVSADESDYGLGPAASKIYRTERGLSIGGYGEILYQKVDDERDNGTASGRKDQFDLLRGILYFGYKWNDRFLFNTEIEYEHAGEEVAVEFAYLDYLWRPEANFRAGLVLLPMGFINELHEPTVFLGANRPQIERIIIPSTWRENGVGLFGEAGPVSYRTYVVNGFDASGFASGGLRGGRQNGGQANAEDMAWVGRLDFTGVPGFLVGGSAYVGNSGQGLAGGSVDVGTQILEGHLEWRWRGLELRALGVQADLDDVTALNAALGFTGNQSVGEKLTGHYLQLGYDVLAGRGGESALIPYARWEIYNTQDEVPSGFLSNPANDVESLTLGLAYKPIEQLILKADYQDVDNEAGTGVDQLNVLLGYVF
ncbi:MAG TPA: hypothetical protein VLQ45_19425 [Thermoanaerobaculia bacterium]|nr:hypothetical protein [Thermoanaerobaculia bacterium]